jgi:hypothetical protein
MKIRAFERWRRALGSNKAGLAAALLALLIALPYKAAAASAPTTTNLAMAAGANSLASNATVPSGTVLTFVASVSAGSTKLTQGQVTLCDASAASCTDIHQFGTAQLTSAGTARFRFVPGIGSHSYKAVFAATPGASPAYAASSSATMTLAVSGSAAKAKTTTTLTLMGSAGQISMTATVEGIVNRPGLAAPTGNVSFLNATAANPVLGISAVGQASSGVNLINSDNPPLAIAPTVIATADFNGDGFPDLVVGNYNTGTALLDVLLGNGDGSFTPVATPVGGHYTTRIAVGDFNGDGIPDLAAASIDDYTVTILLGNGDGTFRAAPSSVPITAQDMVTGDFNGDGIADLATAEGYAVSIFLGKGNGTFTAAGKNSWPEVNPLYLAAGDFNGDGRTDIAVTDTAVKGTIFLLLNKGDGSFSKTDLSPTTGLSLGGIAAGDLNGDGLLDLVLANFGGGSSNGVTVLLGKGDGAFQPPKLYGATPLGQRSVVIGDFNGDGIPDLASGQGGSVALSLGKGDGTFGDALVEYADGGDNGYLATADFNGDGVTDLALPSAGIVNVLLAQPTESITATLPSVLLTKPGSYQMQAKYSGDALYQSSSSAVDNVIFRLTPTVTALPSATSVTSPDPLTVAVVVGGVKGYPVPTGVVNLTNATLYSSGYISNYSSLSDGTATISIPTSALHTGTNILTVNYLPDAASQSIYEGQTGSATVVVTPPPVAATPLFSPPAGTYSSAQNVTFTDTTPSSTMYYTLDGSDPTSASTVYSGPIEVTSTKTVKAIAIANGYAASPISTASYIIGASASKPVLVSLSPALTSAGGQGFALTVNGSSFSGSSIIFWGATRLATQFVNGTQLVAQVPAADTVTAGTIPITVQTPAPGGVVPGEVVSNVLKFEIDSATAGSTAVPVFTTATATIHAGSTATYPVTLPSTATTVSAICLNLPAGATCTYSSGAIAISTLSTTPAGSYTVTVVFTETEPGAASSIALLPILLLPFACSRKKTSSRPLWFTALLGTLFLITAASITACGGSSGSTQTPPTITRQVTSSATVSLTVQ